MLHVVKNMILGFEQLLYPEFCPACGKESPPMGAKICYYCEAVLAYTDHHKVRENGFYKRLCGRLPFEAAGALLYFSKGNRTQNIIHAIKYRDKKKLAVEMGRVHGSLLAKSPHFRGLDMILPVPLHYKKKRIRGYNQSAKYAKGISKVLGIPYSDKILVRRHFTETQTRKTRSERFRNVDTVFDVKKPERLNGMHILVVDDVLTTGATLEACGRAILTKAENVRLSFATLAMAKRF